jgi:biotin carboxyl carrier protein
MDEKEKTLPENPEQEMVQFPLENVSYKTRLTRKYQNRQPYTPPDPKKITAFIPGTIMKVAVKEKSKVKEGETLIVLQAMKMDNHLIAPFNTEVKKIYVKQGERVTKNQLLLEFK